MRVTGILVIALACLGLAACEPSTPQATQTTKPVASVQSDIPRGQLPENIAPLHYSLDLTINPDQLRYEGVVEIEIELKAPKREFYIHGKNLDVGNIMARTRNNATIKGTYTQVHDDGVALLSFEQQLPTGHITVRLPFSSAFETFPVALTSMTDNGIHYVWSQFEEFSARRAFPCFDEPRFKTPFDISITTIERDAAISNTLPLSQEKIADGVIKTTFATTAPLPTYLVAIAVGPYEIVPGRPVAATALRATPLPLRAITVAGKGARTAFALDNTPALIIYLEDYFAAPFPYPKLDIIAPPNFVAGGMENAGAITYTERGILLEPDASVQQKRYFAYLHAHEVSHQWFGDLVTPKWWNDIWLNESFASWMGNKSAAMVWPAGEFDRATLRDALDVMDADALATARAIRQPIKTNDDIVNAFDGLTYDKGAAVLAMFEAYLGPDAFRDGVRLHMRRFAHSTADVHDFMDSLSQATKHPEIVPAIESFLNQPGVPMVRVVTTCAGKDLEVSMSQTPFAAQSATDKRIWSVPVCMRELGRGGYVPCAMLNQRSAKFAIKNLCNAVLMPNARGTGYYRFALSHSDWQKLVVLTAKMAPAEQLSALHSLRAAFRAGDADATIYLAALKASAASNTWDVVDQVRVFLAEIRGNLLVGPDRATLDQATRSWFEKPMKKVGLVARPGERPAIALLRASLAEVLTRVGRDPATLSALSVAGSSIFKPQASGGKIKPAPAELVPLAMWAAIHTGGLPAVQDAIGAINASSNAEFRSAAIRALSAAREEAAISRSQEFVISGALRLREISTYLREAFADADIRAQTWNWFQRDFKRITASVPEENRARFIDLPSRLCTDTAHKEVDALFRPMLGKIMGAPRKLANTLETIDNCLAWRKQKGPEISRALQATP